MNNRIVTGSIALILLAAATTSASSVAADERLAEHQAADAQCGVSDPPCSKLESTIAFGSSRDGGLEIYLMAPDGSTVRRLTNNTSGELFADLSPDGKKIVFDSNRNRVPNEPANTSDLFVMKADGSEQTPLLRGSSASWSPDSKWVVFHRSGSGTGLPIKTDPGAATTDSDIFVVKVEDFLDGTAQPTNLTNNGAVAVDDDPDWSPVGEQIVFASEKPGEGRVAPSAELYVINADGTGLKRLTDNAHEERSPDWSPDGERLTFTCDPDGIDQSSGFEICVMNADGRGLVRLSRNTVPELSPSWSPDGERIAFQRPAADGLGAEIWSMKADGTDQMQLTETPGPATTLGPNWGWLRVHSRNRQPEEPS